MLIFVFQDGKTAMIVLLPNNHELDPNLQILSKDLSYIPMSALLANLHAMEVNLILPKFSIENKLDLRFALEHVSVTIICLNYMNFFNIFFFLCRWEFIPCLRQAQIYPELQRTVLYTLKVFYKMLK